MSKEERRGIVMRGRERRREMEKGRERITRKENSVLPNWEVGGVGNFFYKGPDSRYTFSFVGRRICYDFSLSLQLTAPMDNT